MKISVIVPVYNVQDYIIRCIDSLINQTFKDFEIIVVNDGSKDNSLKLLEEKFNDDRIKIVYKENGGIGSARNSGVRYARGEYLYFLDGDDFLVKTALDEMYQIAKEGDYDIVYTDYYKYFSKENYDVEALVEHYDAKNLKSLVTGMPTASCKLIKRQLYLDSKIRFLEGHIFEDNAIIPLLSALAKKKYYYRKACYYYVQRVNSTLNKKEYNKSWEDIFIALSHLQKQFLQYDIYQDYSEELEYIYIEYLLHAANLRFIDYPEGVKNIKVVHDVMKKNFPHFKKNKYYKEENLKYKIICTLFYHQQIGIIKLIRRLKRRGKQWPK